jgi:hypothetical protein
MILRMNTTETAVAVEVDFPAIMVLQSSYLTHQLFLRVATTLSTLEREPAVARVFLAALHMSDHKRHVLQLVCSEFQGQLCHPGEDQKSLSNNTLDFTILPPPAGTSGFATRGRIH